MTIKDAALPAAYLAWLAWTIVVVTHYFGRPDELLAVADGPLDSFPYWREAARAAVRATAGAALALVAAWGVGSWITGRLPDRVFPGAGDASPLRAPARTAAAARGALALEPAERLAITLASGLAALGFGFLGLAFLHLYTPAMTAAILFAAGAGGLFTILRGGPRIPSFELPSIREGVFAACAGLAVGCAFLASLAPESEYDALSYHLWLPAQWLAAGRHVDLVEEYVSLYPLSWDLVGGAAMVVGGPGAARLLHFACLPLLGVAAFLLTRRLCPRASPMLGAALAIATPLTIWEGTTAYVDLALAWYLAVSVLALVRHIDSGDRRWLLISAFLMGAALAMKHLALVALPIVISVLAAHTWWRVHRADRVAAIAALYVSVALVLPAPWYARAYLASGNPVFPVMYGVFGATPPERWSPATERSLRAFMDRFGPPRTPRHLLLLPWDATVHGWRYGGTLGPLFLILVPAALLGRGVRRSGVVAAAGCAAYAAVWASPIGSFQMRFLIPLVPLLAALGAEGAARVDRAAQQTWRGGRLLTAGTVTMLLLFNLPPTSGWHEPDRDGNTGWMTHILRELPVRVVLGAESRDDYLARTVPSFRAWQYIEAALPRDVLVLTFSGGDNFYSTRPRLWSDSTVARPATWDSAAGSEPAARQALQQLGITHVLFDRAQVARGGVDRLAIGSDAMRACCLTLEYEDARFALYRVSTPPSSSPESATALHACGTWNCPSIRTPGSTWSVVLPSHQASAALLAASRTTATRQ